jgi:glutamyl-tRNA synthetase
MSNSNVVTRFAPSPTGFLHVGGARSALFNYIFAKQNNGKIILRIEDTDTERNKPEYAEGIIKAFDWLGLKFDKTHKQSENFPAHRKYIEKLIANGNAYVSKEKVVEEGQRAEVIRFKNPNKDIIFDDLIKGQVKFNTTELGDFVIAKSLDEPIFHVSNVVDDITSGITHVIRGEEHLSNTPRQILIWEAIGEAPRPIYGHIPLILGDSREKISKRKHGEIVSVEYYRKNGYLPEALLNFLAFLGWNPGGDREILSLDEMIKLFDISKVQKAGAIFNPAKLLWFNREYVLKLSDEAFIDNAKPFLPSWLKSESGQYARLLPLIREKTSTFGDIGKLFEDELAFVNSLPEYKSEMLLWKKNPSREAARKHIIRAREAIEGLPDSETAFTAEAIKSALWKYAEENGKGDVLWPLRTALTGQERSPDPFTSAAILGKVESLKRIDSALAKLA